MVKIIKSDFKKKKKGAQKKNYGKNFFSVFMEFISFELF